MVYDAISSVSMLRRDVYRPSRRIQTVHGCQLVPFMACTDILPVARDEAAAYIAAAVVRVLVLVTGSLVRLGPTRVIEIEIARRKALSVNDSHLSPSRSVSLTHKYFCSSTMSKNVVALLRVVWS